MLNISCKNDEDGKKALKVKQMVDLLGQENPDCFDDQTHTFADMYMKSGLYITEIIKRLYNSDGMKQAFSDDDVRLKHIISHQVFVVAPTEIIFQIATHSSWARIARSVA